MVGVKFNAFSSNSAAGDILGFCVVFSMIKHLSPLSPLLCSYYLTNCCFGGWRGRGGGRWGVGG